MFPSLVPRTCNNVSPPFLSKPLVFLIPRMPSPLIFFALSPSTTTPPSLPSLAFAALPRFPTPIHLATASSSLPPPITGFSTVLPPAFFPSFLLPYASPHPWLPSSFPPGDPTLVPAAPPALLPSLLTRLPTIRQLTLHSLPFATHPPTLPSLHLAMPPNAPVLTAPRSLSLLLLYPLLLLQPAPSSLWSRPSPTPRPPPHLTPPVSSRLTILHGVAH